jgi:hypothetical protein
MFILFWLVPNSYAYSQSLLPRSQLALLENWALDFVVIDADENISRSLIHIGLYILKNMFVLNHTGFATGIL